MIFCLLGFRNPNFIMESEHIRLQGASIWGFRYDAGSTKGSVSAFLSEVRFLGH